MHYYYNFSSGEVIERTYFCYWAFRFLLQVLGWVFILKFRVSSPLCQLTQQSCDPGYTKKAAVSVSLR